MRKRKAWMVVGLLAAAVSLLVLSPWHGAIAVSLSQTHGIDTGDLPAVGLIAIAIAIVRSRHDTAEGAAPWMRAGRTLSAAAATLGALLVIAGVVQALSGPSLVPAGGGTFEGMTEHVDSRLHLPVGRWSHLAVTYDGTTLRFYLDGVLTSSRAVSGRLRATHDPLWMGGNRPYGEYFVGELDEVTVYNRALAAGDVRRLMSTPLSQRPPTMSRGLVAAYPLDSGAGRIAIDGSGRGNNGAIDGATWTPDGHFGGALRFEVGGDRVRIPESPSLDLTRTMTLSAWVPAQQVPARVANRPPPADRRVLPRCGKWSRGGGHARRAGRHPGRPGRPGVRVALRGAGGRLSQPPNGGGRVGHPARMRVVAVAALVAPTDSALADGSDGGARSIALGVLFLAVGLFTVGDTGETVTPATGISRCPTGVDRMSQADIDVVRGSHEAFRRRDFDAFLEYMDPGIEFTSLVLEVEGTYRGHDGIRAWWDDILAVFPDWQPQVEDARELCGHVVLRVRAEGAGTGSGIDVDRDDLAGGRGPRRPAQCVEVLPHRARSARCRGGGGRLGDAPLRAQRRMSASPTTCSATASATSSSPSAGSGRSRARYEHPAHARWLERLATLRPRDHVGQARHRALRAAAGRPPPHARGAHGRHARGDGRRRQRAGRRRSASPRARRSARCSPRAIPTASPTWS